MVVVQSDVGERSVDELDVIVRRSIAMDGEGRKRETLEPTGGSVVERVLRQEQLVRRENKTKPNIEETKTSKVLERLQQFLPELNKANQELEEAMKREPRKNFQLDDVEDEDAQHIEMNLGLGVVDLKDEAAQKAAEKMMAVGGGLDAAIESYDGGEESSDSEGDQNEDLLHPNKRSEGGNGGNNEQPIIAEIK